MAQLDAIPIVDMNGDGVKDDQDVDLMDDALTVSVGANGILQVLSWGWSALSPLAGIDDIIDAIDTILDILNPPGGTQIDTRIGQIYNIVASVNYGNAAIKSDTADTLAIVQTLPTEAGGGLTTQEHDKLMGLDNTNTETVASDVWGYVLPVENMTDTWGGLSAGQVVENIFYDARTRAGLEGTILRDNPHFAMIAQSPTDLSGFLANYYSTPITTDVPKLDLSTIQAGDTAWVWINREYPTYAWLRDFPEDDEGGKGVYLSSGGDPPQYGWRLILTDADIQALWPMGELPPFSVTVNMPPILDPATYTRVDGDPISFDAPFIFTGACDGLTYVTTTRGGGVKGFAVEDKTALTGAGVVGFFGADGLPEKFQYINWDSGVLTPMTMAHAEGFVWSSNVSLSGTVTPFTLEPV